MNFPPEVFQEIKYKIHTFFHKNTVDRAFHGNGNDPALNDKRQPYMGTEQLRRLSD